MTAAVNYAHIKQNEDGVPYIHGTTTKVKEIALDQIAYRWTAEEIQRNHPDLTLAQIHSALAYYYDHQQEIEQAIEDGLKMVESIRASLDDSSVRMILRERKADP